VTIIEIKKVHKTFRTSIFRLMEPVYRRIALWGSPQGGAEAQPKSPAL